VPSTVDLSQHVEGLREALAAFIDHAGHAGLDAPVPTAPDWTVRQLVAHQGMVHRWAAANLRGATSHPSDFEAEGLATADPLMWLHDGGLDVIDAIESAPDDVDAPVFLQDAPPPRQFWARRQCHETTVHSVDALAARLGRVPRADETWVTREMALDGIDELLVGFLTRRKSRLRSDEPVTFGVRPNDVRRSWLVRVSTEAPVVERDVQNHADVVLEASAETLYLALWNRSDEIKTDGFDLWRRTARVTWA
jgi:uncharacterized protein (TIGR03083 family)